MPFPFSESVQPPAQDVAPRIDAVLFDYGQVLSNPPDPTAWARLLAVTGLDDPRLHAAYWKFRHDYDRGALTGPTYWQAVAAETGIKLNGPQITALLAADVDLWSSLNLPMVDWAARLQHAGVRTGILSNIGDSMAAGLVARFAWLSGFDQCIWSYALSMAKPEPAIFLRTAEALRTAPANILFIDDREDNIAAATALGMQGIRYADFEGFEREMRRLGFDSLLEIGLPSNNPQPSDAKAQQTAPTTR